MRSSTSSRRSATPGCSASTARDSITDWKAMPWTAGGSAAIVLKDPSDAATRAEVRDAARRARPRAGQRHRPRPRGRPAAPARRLSHRVVPGRAQAGLADGLEPHRPRPVRDQAERHARAPARRAGAARLVLPRWSRRARRPLARRHRHARRRADPRAPPGPRLAHRRRQDPPPLIRHRCPSPISRGSRAASRPSISRATPSRRCRWRGRRRSGPS